MKQKIWNPLPLVGIRLWKFISSEWKRFVMEKSGDLLHNGLSLPPRRGFFTSLHHENLVEFLELKYPNAWEFPLHYGSQEFLTTTVRPYSISNHSSKCSRISTSYGYSCFSSWWASLSCVPLDALISAVLRGGRWAFVLWPHSLMIQEKLLIFHLSSLFLL